MSLSLATLDAVGRMKLDPVLRRTGAGELGTDTVKCAVFVSVPAGKLKKKKGESIIGKENNKQPHNKNENNTNGKESGCVTNINRKQISVAHPDTGYGDLDGHSSITLNCGEEREFKKKRLHVTYL